MQHFKNRLLLLLWASAILQIFIAPLYLRQFTALILIIYLVCALFSARRETLFIVVLISALSAVLLSEHYASIVEGLNRAMVFVALLPTLQLSRATARRLSAIQNSQQRFQTLPNAWANIGILFGSQAFGSVLNTGAFAFMSSVIDTNSSDQQRRAAALASLRGMNTAVLWSPFFVGFAVANTYLPAVQLWQILPLGLGLVACAMLLALLLFTRPLSVSAVQAALLCLTPLVWPIAAAAFCVITVSLLSALSTLQAVLLVMPILCLLQFLSRPGTTRAIVTETYHGLNRMGDDMLIIVAAMVLGTVAENAPLISQQISPWLSHVLPQTLVIAAIIIAMTGCGMAGLHPMISGTVLMVSLSGANQQISDLVLMEAFLIGWALASMTSISSLSILSAGAMYQVAPLKLAFSRNLIFVALFALFSIVVLNGLDAFL